MSTLEVHGSILDNIVGEEKRVLPPATLSTVLTILQSMCRSSQSVADAILTENKEQTLKGLTAVLQVCGMQLIERRTMIVLALGRESAVRRASSR